MPITHGAFVWHELMTGDMKSAETFYKSVVGWSCRDSGTTGMDYAIFSAGEAMTAGLMHIPDDAKKMGAPPSWSGYVSVDDVDAAAVKLKSLGGKVVREPADIPDVGRFSVVADPQGAYFQLFKSASPGPGAPPPDTPGRVGWNELYALDMEKVFPFYAEMFGWVKSQAVDMGPMGKYQLFSHDGKDIGGMMTRPPHIPVALWCFYFNVADIASGVARVNAGGGRIVNGPMQVPGGHHIAQALDPQGALFALVSANA